MQNFTAEALLALFGIFLSLAQWLIPPFRRFQEEGLGEWTPLFSIGVFLLITSGVLAWNCQMVLGCMAANWQSYWSVFASAVVTYYGSYQAYVKQAKDKQKADQQAELIRTQAIADETAHAKR